ncbi:hypothetical protein [Streptomyces sp. SPB162]|uniref:hypothetical protein n=1 Tax=Streptomyces sp. SPB162 TaxID=2940560 RepID=UPI0024073AD6|nr:hypothetical protein [Streptomyces sp. SPB162]
MEIFERLLQDVAVSAVSNAALVGSVDKAAHADDKRRQKEQQKKAEEATREGRPTPSAAPAVELRRKQQLRALPDGELATSVGLTYFDVLHHLARGLSLTQRGAARGLAEHWGSLKYIQAVQAAKGSLLWLSAEGKRTVKYYKTLQSDELGHAFALAIAERILRNRYPDHSVSIMHSDTVLRAGWALNTSERVQGQDTSSVGYRYRPQYLAEVWKPSQPSLVFPIACKGHHGGATASYGQLASSAAYVDGLHIGPWNETPGFVFSTGLPLDGPLAVYALHAQGDGGRLTTPPGTDAAEIDMNQAIRQANLLPGIQRPHDVGRELLPAPGCQVRPENFPWFGRVLAHTDAAGLTAFAGAGRATAQLLTKRQGSEFFRTFEHAASGSVQDIERKLLDDHFAGTDHVFPPQRRTRRGVLRSPDGPLPSRGQHRQPRRSGTGKHRGTAKHDPRS